jgi:hypothetical protein
MTAAGGGTCRLPAARLTGIGTSDAETFRHSRFVGYGRIGGIGTTAFAREDAQVAFDRRLPAFLGNRRHGDRYRQTRECGWNYTSHQALFA